MPAMSTGLLQHLAVFLLLTQLTHSAPAPKIKNHTQHKVHRQASNTYIVHCNHLAKPLHFADLEQWYHSMVAAHSRRASAANTSSGRILYVYDAVMHGFAVQLTSDKAWRMSSVAGVLGVYEDRPLHTHTTRSPGFLGLDPGFGAWKDTDFGDGVIIGVIDGGIWPESPSFNDSGLGPVRSSWRGKCVDAGDFSSSLCNNKLIGAKAFDAASKAMAGRNRGHSVEIPSPRDIDGHGTHVSSTAASSEVSDPGMGVFSRGTARGMAPKARISMYKVCSIDDCPSADIVAGIDAAVKDGVDIISMSLGAKVPPPPPFHSDGIAIATFGAVRAGVFVVLSGGNKGPNRSSIVNVAPWVITVGAATVDRLFPANLKLGNGAVLTGQSIYTNGTTVMPLVSSSCEESDLTPEKISGKIVFCVCDDESTLDSKVIRSAGGAGLSIEDCSTWSGDGVSVDTLTLPGITLSFSEAENLKAYMASVPHPVASLSYTCDTVIAENRAPMVASFSSRGPNPLADELLKPDVIAPGINILAAGMNDYHFDSGTSMACPHVAGVAALIKKKYPRWTPAMIRSALMTTAGTLDNMGRDILDAGVIDGHQATAAMPFAAGSGHVRPQLALDPGLVYDAGERDYIDFLCSLNYTADQMRVFVPDFINCTRSTLPGGVAGFNYPSFVVVFDNNTDVRTLMRTVTMVSEKAETYIVTVSAPDRVKVTVTPTTLELKKPNERKSYTVEFKSLAGGNGTAGWDFGHISWENSMHQVRSPIAFMWKN